jgi:hypothetical protein
VHNITMETRPADATEGRRIFYLYRQTGRKCAFISVIFAQFYTSFCMADRVVIISLVANLNYVNYFHVTSCVYLLVLTS